MTSPLRIVHCLRAPVGGLFRHVLDLAAEQVAIGHAVGVIAGNSVSDALTDQRFAELQPRLKLGLHRIPMGRLPGPQDVRAGLAVARIASELNADILHGHGAKGGAYARLAARLKRSRMAKTAIFYTPHGGTVHFAPSSLEGRVYLNLERALARVTGGVIFESGYAQRMFEDRIGLKDTPWRVIHNGLQPIDFSPHAPRPNAADVLFIGELRHLKGVDVLLTALAALNKERPVTAVVVGDGPDAATFKEQAKALGLNERVRFAGALPAREAFGLGRVLAVPSRAESLPYVVLEAAAAGMPLVATNVGGIPEIVQGTETRLVLPGDAVALSEALSALLDDPSAAQATAQRLNSAVAERFTAKVMSAAIEGFYRDALEHKRHR